MLSQLASIGLLTYLATGVIALPAKSIEKRHSNCWSVNTAGCEYPIVGKQGAVVSVSPATPHLDKRAQLTVRK
jgi:hypothetical protein